MKKVLELQERYLNIWSTNTWSLVTFWDTSYFFVKSVRALKKSVYAFVTKSTRSTLTITVLFVQAGSLMHGIQQYKKTNLAIAPVITQLGQGSTSTTAAIATQSPKHITNLLLPVNIPQTNVSVPTKSNMFNVKLNNGQISADGKGTITGESLFIFIL